MTLSWVQIVRLGLVQMKERAVERSVPSLGPMACGGGREQMQEPAE